MSFRYESNSCQPLGHGTHEFRVPDRPVRSLAEFKFGSQPGASLREFAAGDQQFCPKASPQYSPERRVSARCDVDQHRYRLIRGLQIAGH
jgi:hypothetical protein